MLETEKSDALTRALEIFQALTEPMRIKILQSLEERDYCVCELMGVLNLSQPAVSYHVGLLADAGLITTQKKGRKVICKLRKKGLITQLLKLVESL
jgi:ArsR family transcriptional regulator